MASSPENDPEWIEFKRIVAEQKRWLDSLTPEQRLEYDIMRIVASARRGVNYNGGTTYLAPHQVNADRIYAALSDAFERVEVVEIEGVTVWKVTGRPEAAESRPEAAKLEAETQP